MTHHTQGCPVVHCPGPGRTTPRTDTHGNQDRERPPVRTESAIRCRRGPWDWLAQPTALFGGVYGLLVSSSAVAALTQFGEVTRAARMDDAVWVLFTALASALAHGYAHQIAHRDAQGRPGIRGVVRAVLAEWPLVVAALPTTLLLWGGGPWLVALHRHRVRRLRNQHRPAPGLGPARLPGRRPYVGTSRQDRRY